MKTIPNSISYLHNFFWNFSQFLAIYFERFSSGVILIRKTLTSGSHMSDAAIRTRPTWQRAVKAWLPHAAPRPCIKCTIGTTRRRPDSAAPFRPRHRRCPNCLASPHLAPFRLRRRHCLKPRRRRVRIPSLSGHPPPS
jgi:hypothetical protein